MHQVGTFATLKVVSIQGIGAFLDWGHPKELFLPLREQVGEVFVDEELVVFITHDNSQRPIATMLLEEHLDPNPDGLYPNQKVDLLIIDESELGFGAIINHRFRGILYRSEVFQRIGYGDSLPGYVKKIREDGKVDLILHPTGIRGSGDLGEQILERLRSRGGYLALTEKSPPELIYNLFGVSKKKFKIALGGIYKKQLVTLEEEGIRLVSPTR